MSDNVLQYWVYYKLPHITIDPRYETHEPGLVKKQLSISPEVTIAPEKDKEFWALCAINLETEQITQLLETKPPHKFVSNNEINETIKHNNTIKAKNKEEMTKAKFERPEDLFIPDTTWNLINATVELGKYPLLIGPKGGGKTSTAQEIAKARGMDFYPINCGSIFKPKQTLVGQMQAKEGTTYLLQSEFLQYFTSDKPTLIFLDEISRIPSAAANYFMTILDRLQSYIYVEEEGRRVYKGKNVTFIAAANFGHEYTDTRNLDGALMDRFIKFIIDYLPENEEIDLIKKRVPKAVPADVRQLVQYASHCREAKEKLRVTVSTRQLIDMCEYLTLGFDVTTIYENIFSTLFVNGSSDEREAVDQILSGVS